MSEYIFRFLSMIAVLFLANVWFSVHKSSAKAVGEVSEPVIEKTVQAASTKQSLYR